MRKLLIVMLAILLVSCKKEKNEEIKEDNIAPLVFVDGAYLSHEVKQNVILNFDQFFLQGVTAIDDVDGDLTAKIEIDYADFDISTPGRYKIYFFVHDNAQNKSNLVSKTIIVKHHYEILESYPIYLNSISGEKPTPGPQRLFRGAWYHKVVSSRDQWLGMEGTIVLPEVKIRRYDGDFDSSLDLDPWVKNLDNPSIYMGGNATYESDVGLTLSLVHMKNPEGNNTISTGSYAFRPFWRYITSLNDPDKDIGVINLTQERRYGVTALNATETNMYANWYNADSEFYYLPGDKLRLILYSPKPNFLQLQVEVLEKSSLASSIKIREDNNWRDPEDFTSPLFKSEGHGTEIFKEYKRVNAIDQVGREGIDALKSETEVRLAKWESVYLFRKIGETIYRVPFNSRRSSLLNAPLDGAFITTPIEYDTGGTTVIIDPKRTINEEE
ncbi:MAG: DUF5011 domain-containing protein [Acholeplasmataceae bacterium]|nr:DUF5011 domain-containing protein [Acholeplasmataceae bacterium]